MHNKNRGIGSGGIDLLQSWHAPLLKLKLAPATHHSDPLRRWCPSGLVLQHGQSFRERGYAVPPQLHVVVETTANGMHVGIIQSGNYSPIIPVHQVRFRPAQANNFFVRADGSDFSMRYSNGLNERRISIGCNFAVVEN